MALFSLSVATEATLHEVSVWKPINMTRKSNLLLAIALVSTIAPECFSQSSMSVAYEYASVSFPGASVTNVNGINNSNVMVGSYFDSQDVVHGFIYREGKFTAVNFPGATETEVLGINDNDDVVGTYQMPGPLNFHGFLKRGTTFIAIDDPDATFGTMAFGINKAGMIVGSYDNASGFTYENGSYQTVNAPQLAGESHQTQLNGINNLGWVVGQVFTGGIWRGFWIVNGKLHFLEPATSTDNQATGINGHEDVVGCHDTQVGFLSFAVQHYSGLAGNFPPEQVLTSCATAINYARVVVGSFFTVKNSNGFVAVPALTLQVSSPENKSSISNPAHISATAFGKDPISQMQIWVNYHKIFQVRGGTLNSAVTLPIGANERFVVEAIDSKGRIAKVVDSITIN